MENDDSNEITDGNDIIEKARSLYEFLLKFSELKHPTIVNLNSCAKKSIDEFPEDPVNIKINYCDTVAESASEEPSEELPLLVIHKPEFERCPLLPEELNGWIANGWNDYRKEEVEKFNCRYKSTNLPVFGEVGDDNDVEYFDDDVHRSEVLNNWLKKRIDWVNRQKSIAKTRRLFEVFYDFHMGMQRDSENLELIVANGFFESAVRADVKYPILSKKVRTVFNARKSEICVYDDDSKPELYSDVFGIFNDMYLGHLSDLKESLERSAYHPLDRNETPGFLKEVITRLTLNGLYCEQEPPAGWKNTYQYICYWKPIYVLRPRPSGATRMIQRIIDDIDSTGCVPPHIVEIIAPGKIEERTSEKEESFAERLASIGGESTEVLLAKEANREQLNIAKRIEQNNAVVVQGPPGTGKTHTIANLLGHFLAQGKSVLVTSFTTKALKVLKEKVSEKIQPLCVSVVDDDKTEMLRSINGITDEMGRITSTTLKDKMKSCDEKRRAALSDICKFRQKLYSIRYKERNTLTYNGESLSPSAAANFVSQNENFLNYIPGRVTVGHLLPLSLDELVELYRTNVDVSIEESNELACQLPNPQSLISPEEFESQTTLLQRTKSAIESFAEKTGWTFDYDNDTQSISIYMDEQRHFIIPKPDTVTLDELLSISERFKELEPWMKHAAVDGRDNDSAKKKWYVLIDQILELCKLSEQFDLDTFGKELLLPILDEEKRAEFLSDISAMYKIKANGATIGKLKLLLNPRWKKTLAMVTINGKSVSEARDFKIILDSFTLEEKRKDCERYWDQLIQKAGGKKFFELDAEKPENIARNFIDLIKIYTEWYQTDYEPLNKILSLLSIDAELFFGFTRLDSTLQRTDKIFHTVFSDIKPLVEICRLLLARQDIINAFSGLQNELTKNDRCKSVVCSELCGSIDKRDSIGYREAYIALKETYDKYAVLEKRNQLIEKLRPFAPEWAQAIHDRLGIHGRGSMPDNIEDAWRWKQYSAILDDLLAEDYDELQKHIMERVSEYHKWTAEYVVASAWFHLIKSTETNKDLKASLMGWAKTVQAIGRTNTPRSVKMRQKAREQMAECQRAVPAWIMPISKAMSNLDPTKKFDVIIIDEASQADITTLAIAYMAKKIIIVGDDKQVTPMSVGILNDKVNALITEYLEGRIKNAQLYNERSSIYDIAGTTYTTLMLEEHFRCVPEIIGFSNMLSYYNRIKPLRDPTTSILLPHVVNYRVAGGIRSGQVNDVEAKTIVALMKACLEQEEYANKSFGVIAMLGNEQALKIQKIIAERIALRDIDERRILCGEPPNFQGDERDVIFLSLVDNGDGKGPVRFLAQDANMNMWEKRYNVAASRPKDQLWVVHSLDSANDLQNGDIRKKLIDYANAPESFIVRCQDIEKHTESPFEKEVAKALIARGFHIEPQYPVGAYRIDFVVKYQDKEVAFECDGERYHQDLYADMERQQILERLGWRFVRLRGGEYYRNKEKSIDRVVSDFNALGIFPEHWEETTKSKSRSSELLERVKTRAAAILKEWEEEERKEAEALYGENSHRAENEDHNRNKQRTQLDLFGNEII